MKNQFKKNKNQLIKNLILINFKFKMQKTLKISQVTVFTIFLKNPKISSQSYFKFNTIN